MIHYMQIFRKKEVLQIHFWHSKVKWFEIRRNTKWPLGFGSSIALPEFNTACALKRWKGRKRKKRRPTRSVRRKKSRSGSLFSKIQQPHVLSSSQSTVKYSFQQLDIEQHNLTRSSRGVSLKEIVIHVHKSHLLAGCVLIFNNYVQIVHLWIWQLILLKIIWLPNKSWRHRHVI